MDARKTGTLIREARTSLGLTQADLAERVGVSDKAVSKWERGAGCPDIEILPGVARAVGLSVEALLEGETGAGPTDPGDMRRLRFYRCPTCGNVLTSTGTAGVTCCGRPLDALVPRPADDAHRLDVSHPEGDLLLTWDHPMEKGHYLAFIACVTCDRVLLVRLYPEQSGELCLPWLRGGRIYVACSDHGLFWQEG